MEERNLMDLQVNDPEAYARKQNKRMMRRVTAPKKSDGPMTGRFTKPQ
jgi:hypothetical protein